MTKLSFSRLLAFSPAIMSTAFISTTLSAAEPATASQFIDTFAKVFGQHPGERKGHAKGFCASGQLKALPAAQDFNKIAWLSGADIAVTARFSMAGGNPKAAENSRSPRGLGLQLTTADGQLQHFTLLTTPVFGAKDPETFLGLLQTQIPDPTTGKADMAKVQVYRAAHPDTQAQAAFLAKTPPPWSYATTPYFGIHTFFIKDNTGKEHKIRWQFVPTDGVKGLSDSEIKAPATDFLQTRFRERLNSGPVAWTLQFVFGDSQDTETDPSIEWPSTRKTMDVARLVITAEGADACKQVNFDPNVLSQGVRASADRVLQMRSAAYAISFGKRMSGQ